MVGWIAFATYYVIEYHVLVRSIVAISILYIFYAIWTYLSPKAYCQVNKPVATANISTKTQPVTSQSIATQTVDCAPSVHEEPVHLLSQEQVDDILVHQRIEHAKVTAILQKKLDVCLCSELRPTYKDLRSKYDHLRLSEEGSINTITGLKKTLADNNRGFFSSMKSEHRAKLRQMVRSHENRTSREKHRAEKAEKELSSLKIDLVSKEDLVKDLQAKLYSKLTKAADPVSTSQAQSSTLLSVSHLLKTTSIEAVHELRVESFSEVAELKKALAEAEALRKTE